MHGLESLSYDFFNELSKCESINFNPLVAYFNNVPYGALGLIFDKNYALYWIGASNESAGNLGQGELLQWEAIKLVKTFGCKYYDLCYIEKERLPHIYEFKKGFSRNEIEIPYFNRTTLVFKALNKIDNLL
jgi:lipid II:glycine glycyltransferase (peptidoglycan interpeptide bridge formation enzyme)